MSTSLTLHETIDTAVYTRTQRYKRMVTGTVTKAVWGLFMVRFHSQKLATQRSLEHLRSTFSEAEGDDELDFAAGDDAEFAKALASALEPGYTGGAKAASANFPTMPGSFALDNKAAQEYLAQHAAELVSKVDDTTRSQLNNLITKAREEGWSYDTLAKEISQDFDGFSRSRARTIALYESSDAYETGSADLVGQLQQSTGLDFEKSQIGGDSCPECTDNIDQGWIDEDDKFQSGDDTAPIHPNCDCDTLHRRAGSDEEE